MKKRKIYGKVLLLLPIALVLALQVNAETIYSEYELIGTTEEYKEDTELIKYTPVIMHRFYTLKRTNEVFMPHYYESEESPYKDSYIYNRARSVSNEKNPLVITYKRVAFKCSDCQNSVINKIEITNNNLLEKPVETHISVYGEDTIMHEAKTELSNKISIKLNYNTMISTPRFVVDFDRDINLSLSIKYLHDTEVIYEQNLESDDYLSSEKLVLEVKIKSDYENYMTDKGLLTLEEAQNSNYHKYYTNEILTYKFYNLEKEFYVDSRESYLNGYEYDEEDDYIVYDIYERTILEKIEENPQETDDSSMEEAEEKKDKLTNEEIIEKKPEQPSPKPEEPSSELEEPAKQPEEHTEKEETVTKPESFPKEENEPSIGKIEDKENLQETDELTLEKTEEKEPEQSMSKPEDSKKEENKESPKNEMNEDTTELPKLNDFNEITSLLPPICTEDSKLEIPPVLDNNQPIINDEKKLETKKNELSSDIKTEQTLVKDNKVETVKDIVYILENDNKTGKIDLNKESIGEKDKKETVPLVNEVTEISEKQKTDNTSIILKITFRIIISILALFIIRKILCKTSVNNAK